MDTESEEKKEILQSLGKLGIGYLKEKELIEKHGHKRVAEVVQHTKDQDCKNPAGYVVRALAENWAFWSKLDKMIAPTMMGKDTLPENMRLLFSISACQKLALKMKQPFWADNICV